VGGPPRRWRLEETEDDQSAAGDAPDDVPHDLDRRTGAPQPLPDAAQRTPGCADVQWGAELDGTHDVPTAVAPRRFHKVQPRSRRCTCEDVAVTSPPTPPSAPAGWYPHPDGRAWWWDGERWVHPLPERPVDPGVSSLAHLTLFAVAVIGPIALRLTLGRRDDYLRHHATEALNAQIWFVGLWNAVGIPGYVIFLTSSGAPDVGVFLGVWLTMAALFVLTAAQAVVGAVRAYRGLWWRYPLTPYRFVRGAAPRP
jgi:hypothetical protein